MWNAREEAFHAQSVHSLVAGRSLAVCRRERRQAEWAEVEAGDTAQEMDELGAPGEVLTPFLDLLFFLFLLFQFILYEYPDFDSM